jgi:hypothetical protein
VARYKFTVALIGGCPFVSDRLAIIRITELKNWQEFFLLKLGPREPIARNRFRLSMESLPPTYEK